MQPELKICGITRLEDARFCAAAGAQYLGFIQYEGSPRYIRPKEAREIIEWLHGPKPVGVFVNEPPDVVNRVAEEAGFEYVQLHGTEPPEWCAEIDFPIIKAIHVVHDASAEQLRVLIDRYSEYAEHFLLDTHRTSLYGGTGESFNWRLARELSDDYSLFLAGGIDADNVEEAVQTIRPFAIDLSSSVESAPGIKSFEKLERFFAAWEAMTRNPAL